MHGLMCMSVSRCIEVYRGICVYMSVSRYIEVMCILESIKVYQERARMDLVQGGFKGYPVNISSEGMGFIEHQVSTLLA